MGWGSLLHAQDSNASEHLSHMKSKECPAPRLWALLGGLSKTSGCMDIDHITQVCIRSLTRPAHQCLAVNATNAETIGGTSCKLTKQTGLELLRCI